jgi:hypothetical protein
MVRLRLTDSSLTDELASFLRRCQCEVEHLGPGTVGVGVVHSVDVETAVKHLRSGRCYRCGETIEPGLYGLGSPLCLNCRDTSNGDAGADSAVRAEWARMEVEAYVRVWQALHPEGRVELVS